MNIKHFIAFITFILVITSDSASALTKSEVEERSELIQSWDNMDGTWEGEYKIVYHPEGLYDPDVKTVKIQVAFSNGKVSLALALPGESFMKFGKEVTYMSNELFAKFVIVRQGDIWLESWMVEISRESKDEAKVFLMRTVNNWAEKDSETKVFAVMGAGRLKRIK